MNVCYAALACRARDVCDVRSLLVAKKDTKEEANGAISGDSGVIKSAGDRRKRD